MIFTLLHILLSGVFLVLIPLCAGNALLSVTKLEKSLTFLYFSGLVLIWAVFQMIAVPMVLTRLSFTETFTVLTIVMAMICLYGIYKSSFRQWRFPEYRLNEKIAIICMFLLVSALLLVTFVTQHTDADDSRFVVNAVDMLRTDTMYLTNTATGKVLDYFPGGMRKDVTSPWAVFIAWCAKLTRVHPTIMAHTIFPMILLLAAVCVWWMLSGIFFPENLIYRSLFLDLVLLLNIYGHFSIYSEECFLLTRVWQGKAVVAGIGIPAVYMTACWIYEKGKAQYYALLILLNFALCLMSGMGIIIGAIMLSCIGLVYGIGKRNWRVMCMLWLFCIPNALYYLIYINIS